MPSDLPFLTCATFARLRAQKSIAGANCDHLHFARLSRLPYCPTIQPRRAIDWLHGFRATTALVSADDAAGWVHRHQLIVIEFLQAENRLLKDRLRGKRIRKALLELDTVVSPDTLLRWHRRLIAEKWNFVHRRGPGRPGIMQKISALIVRMAQDNPGWGYTRIQGALGNLGHRVGRGTVANVLKRSGIEPSPERSKRTTWSTFLKAHWEVFAASDFLTVEVWTGRGL